MACIREDVEGGLIPWMRQGPIALLVLLSQRTGSTACVFLHPHREAMNADLLNAHPYPGVALEDFFTEQSGHLVARRDVVPTNHHGAVEAFRSFWTDHQKPSAVSGLAVSLNLPAPVARGFGASLNLVATSPADELELLRDVPASFKVNLWQAPRIVTPHNGTFDHGCSPLIHGDIFPWTTSKLVGTRSPKDLGELSDANT